MATVTDVPLEPGHFRKTEPYAFLNTLTQRKTSSREWKEVSHTFKGKSGRERVPRKPDAIITMWLVLTLLLFSAMVSKALKCLVFVDYEFLFPEISGSGDPEQVLVSGDHGNFRVSGDTESYVDHGGCGKLSSPKVFSTPVAQVTRDLDSSG